MAHLERGSFMSRGGVVVDVREDGSVHVKAGTGRVELSEDAAMILLSMLGSLIDRDDF